MKTRDDIFAEINKACLDGYRHDDAILYCYLASIAILLNGLEAHLKENPVAPISKHDRLTL